MRREVAFGLAGLTCAFTVAAIAACGDSSTPNDSTDSGTMVLPDGAVVPIPTGSTTGTGTGTGTVDPPGPPPNGSTGCGKAATGGFDQGKTLTAAGKNRTYALSVPEGYSPNKAYPLVFAFHGDGGTGAALRGAIKVEEASNGGAIFVYPDGLGKTWDLDTAPDTNADAAFYDELVSTLSAEYCVDSTRIFTTGFSRGGYFSNQLACWRDTVRAAASNGSGGPYGAGGAKFDNQGRLVCPRGKGAPVIIFHGQSDSPSEGQKTLDYWSFANGCPNTNARTDVAPSPCKAVDGCGEPVVWCLVPGLGHQIWPDSNQATWDFFSKL